MEVSLPTGDRFEKHGAGTVLLEPFLSAGTMLGDWYLQTQLKAEFSTDKAKAGHHVVYNTYLGRDTSGAPNTWTIGVELNGEDRELALTPQVRKGLTGTGALAASVGMMVPLNRREEQERWVGYLLWEYLEPWRASLAEAQSITGTITTTAKGAPIRVIVRRCAATSCPMKPSCYRAAWRMPW